MSLLFSKYDINTPARIAGFVAQCGHESNNFKVLEENLNYSAEGLNKIFPKYFIKAGRDAQAYHRQPEKIANVVYASRMGNGDTASGEGWKFRGRGVIQLTGKDNYSRFAKYIGKSIDETIEYLKTKQGALESACWFWKTNGLNEIADSGDIVAMTKRINGGTIGLEDRKKHYEHALAVLGGKAHAVSDQITDAVTQTLKKGANGSAVAKMQKALGIKADGDFGPGTEAALKKWQAANGLTADGVAGPKTLAKLLG
jgi:putative chitinase